MSRHTRSLSLMPIGPITHFPSPGRAKRYSRCHYMSNPSRHSLILWSMEIAQEHRTTRKLGCSGSVLSMTDRLRNSQCQPVIAQHAQLRLYGSVQSRDAVQLPIRPGHSRRGLCRWTLEAILETHPLRARNGLPSLAVPLHPNLEGRSWRRDVSGDMAGGNAGSFDQYGSLDMLQRDSLSERHQSMVNRTSYRWQATQRMPITDT